MYKGEGSHEKSPGQCTRSRWPLNPAPHRGAETKPTNTPQSQTPAQSSPAPSPPTFSTEPLLPGVGRVAGQSHHMGLAAGSSHMPAPQYTHILLPVCSQGPAVGPWREPGLFQGDLSPVSPRHPADGSVALQPKSRLCHLLAVQPRASALTSLSRSLLIHKEGQLSQLSGSRWCM